MRRLAWLILRAWAVLLALLSTPMALAAMVEPAALAPLFLIVAGVGALLALLVWVDQKVLRRLEDKR